MKISYMPPTVCAVTATADQGIIEKAISNAIQNTIVIPFKNWCFDVWTGFVDVSLPACTCISLISLIFYMCGIKKAKDYVIIPIIVYLFIQIANYIISGG